MTGRGVAWPLIPVILLGACAKNTGTSSVYLEVANGAGAPIPTQVRIDIYAGTDTGALGPLLKSFPGLDAQASGDLLGTLVIYPSADLTRIHVAAQGLIGGQVRSRGAADVAVVPRRQVTMRITLAATTDRDAGMDGPAPGDGAAPDGALADGNGGVDDAGATDVPATDAGPDGAPDRAPAPDSGSGGTPGDAGPEAGDGRGGATADAADGPPPGDGGGPPIVASVDFVGTGTPMAVAEQAGVVPATHWNSAASGTGTLTSLIDSNGNNLTGAALSWNAGAATNIYASSIADTAGNLRMMNGYLDPTNGMVATITASALPGALATSGYDVYVYTNGSVPAGETRTFNYAIGSAAVTLTETMAQIFGGTYVMAPAAVAGSGNYVVFRDVRGASFTLTATPGPSTSFFQRSPVNGLQIVGR